MIIVIIVGILIGKKRNTTNVNVLNYLNVGRPGISVALQFRDNGIMLRVLGYIFKLRLFVTGMGGSVQECCSVMVHSHLTGPGPRQGQEQRTYCAHPGPGPGPLQCV